MRPVNPELPYGKGDSSFQAAGGESGILALVNNFYDRMDNESQYRTISELHPEDKLLSREKLAAFLSGWLGGPRTYQQKFGSIGIPAVHRHLPIGLDERDQWLSCMKGAVSEQPYAEDFKLYLLEQLSVPANAIVRVCKLESEK